MKATLLVDFRSFPNTAARWLRSCYGRFNRRIKAQMIQLTPLDFRVLPVALVLVAGTSCWSTASLAQSTPTPAITQPAPSSTGDVMRLTDEERMAILNNNTEDKAAAARGELPRSGPARRAIHGEIGVMVGSHDTRSAYGTADIPLGENAGATVSFESSRFGYRR